MSDDDDLVYFKEESDDCDPLYGSALDHFKEEDDDCDPLYDSALSSSGTNSTKLGTLEVMPSMPKANRTRKGCRKTSPNRLHEAMNSVKLKRMNITDASSYYGIARSTLSEKLSGKHLGKIGKEPLFSKEEEEKMASYIKKCVKCGKAECVKSEMASTVSNMLDLMQSYLMRCKIPNDFIDNRPSLKWFYRFMKRHGISTQKTQAVYTFNKDVVDYSEIVEGYDTVPSPIPPDVAHRCSSDGTNDIVPSPIPPDVAHGCSSRFSSDGTNDTFPSPIPTYVAHGCSSDGTNNTVPLPVPPYVARDVVAYMEYFHLTPGKLRVYSDAFKAGVYLEETGFKIWRDFKKISQLNTSDSSLTQPSRGQNNFPRTTMTTPSSNPGRITGPQLQPPLARPNQVFTPSKRLITLRTPSATIPPPTAAVPKITAATIAFASATASTCAKTSVTPAASASPSGLLHVTSPKLAFPSKQPNMKPASVISKGTPIRDSTFFIAGREAVESEYTRRPAEKRQRQTLLGKSADSKDCAAVICQKPRGRGKSDWVWCDYCEERFHVTCVGINSGELDEEDIYQCPDCS